MSAKSSVSQGHLLLLIGLVLCITASWATNLTVNARSVSTAATWQIPCEFPSQAPPGFVTGTNPFALVSADFNLDNKPDLATVNFGSDSVSILFGDGNGGFGAPANYAVGVRPAAIVAADFNGDGRPDIAVANLGPGTVSILLNRGAGNFETIASLAAGIFPSGLAVSDFNLDGKPDLAVAHRLGRDVPGLDDYVSIYQGEGDGRFAQPGRFKVGPDAGKLIAADFNRDGRPDVAVAINSGNRVTLLTGNDAGGFSSANDFAVGAAPYSLTAADFNRDGVLDLAVADYNASYVSFLAGTSAGSFAAPINFAVGSRPLAIAAGDFNLDGKPDLVTANSGANDFSLLLNDARGGFNSAVSFAAGAQSSALIAADFNRDGQADLAMASFDANQVVVLLNRCVPSGNNRSATLTTLDTLPNPSTAGQTVFFRISVTEVAGSEAPTGNVQLQINSVPLSPWLALVNGRASFQTKKLTVGTHRIVAVYRGDSRYQPSQGQEFQLVY